MIYLDANVIIRFVEGDSATRDPIKRRLLGENSLATSQLSRLECRCHPMRNNNLAVLGLFDRFFAAQELQILDIDPRVIDEATHLRATDGFKSPDAIHLASAVVAGVTHFLTGDLQLARCKRMLVEII